MSSFLHRSARPVGWWFLALAAAVFIMAVIGAITRLTESGLSIVDWKALLDIVPPHDPEGWNKAFALYRTSPQYHDVNTGMSLADYQHIYYWEWLHRFWGRIVLGLGLTVPLIWFGLRGQIDRAIAFRIAAILALGALQGFVGWFMVKSGLEARPSVSHYRLAMHLALAMVLYVALLWNGLDLLVGRQIVTLQSERRLRQHALLGVGMVATTMVWGAFVAGLRAGLIYNSFPNMGAGLMPGEMWFLRPALLNLVQNAAAVQFTHRLLAMTTALVLVLLAIHAMAVPVRPSVRKLSLLLGLGALLQVGLGISTLLHHVPVWMGAAHQAGAITVLSLVAGLLFLMRKPLDAVAKGATARSPTRPEA